MKRNLLFLCLLTLFCQCSNVDESKLIGSWNVVDCKIDAPEINQTIVNGAREMVMSSEFTFHESGQLDFHSKYEDHLVGSWRFEDDHVLSLVHEFQTGEQIQQVTVTLLDDEYLVWSSGQAGVNPMKVFLQRN